jgi:hypothetical protein
MLVVIVIGLIIFTDGKILIFFQQKEMTNLFEPGKMTFNADPNNKNTFTASCVYDEANGQYVPTGITAHVGSISLLDSDKKEGQVVQFVVLLSVANKLYLGTIDGNTIQACKLNSGASEHECPSNKDIVFESSSLLSLSSSGKDYIHISAWRYTPAIQPSIDQIKTGGDISFSKLLDNNYPAYLGSTGIEGTSVQGLCAQALCDQCNGLTGCSRSDCEGNNNICWFDPFPLVGGVLSRGTCSSCNSIESCSTLDQQTCTRCNMICEWDVGKGACDLAPGSW